MEGDPPEKRTIVAPDDVPGYILINGVGCHRVPREREKEKEKERKREKRMVGSSDAGSYICR